MQIIVKERDNAIATADLAAGDPEYNYSPAYYMPYPGELWNGLMEEFDETLCNWIVEIAQYHLAEGKFDDAAAVKSFPFYLVVNPDYPDVPGKLEFEWNRPREDSGLTVAAEMSFIVDLRA